MIGNVPRRPPRLAGSQRPPTNSPNPARRSDEPPPDEPPTSATGELGEEELILFTADQAATRLQLRPSWLRRKAAARAIPCRYVGKHLRFTRDDLTAIAAQYAHTPVRTRSARH